MGTADGASPAVSFLEQASGSFVKGGFAKMGLAALKSCGVFNAGDPIGLGPSSADHHREEGSRTVREGCQILGE